MGKLFFNSAGAVVCLGVKSFCEAVMASDHGRKIRECGVTCLCSTVDSESVLLGNFALMQFVSLVASKLPDLVEVSTKFVD
jgi:hypothetical protein